MTRILFMLAALALPLVANCQQQSGNPPQTANPAPGRLDYRIPAADDRIAVEAKNRQAVHEVCQATVIDLLELYHEAKQSHWNLRGPLYFPLHENLDADATKLLEHTDTFAERSLHVGIPIDGRTETVSKGNNLGAFPAGYLSDKQVLDLMTERIVAVGIRTRKRIEQISKVDEVTSSELQELSYDLDKMVWQLRVHMQ